MSGDPAVMESIRAEIAATGPMRFDRFMEMTLYGPGGFFRSERLRSQREGDFLTSPEVSPSFGTTLARAVAEERARVGRPFVLVEAGAGSGSLLRPLLDALDPAPDQVFVTEASPAARHSLADRLPEASVIDSLDETPAGIRGVILANELLDNLPAALAIRRGRGWTERAVDAAGAGLAWTEVPARAEVAAWAGGHGGRVPDGGQVEAQLAACSWLLAALGRLSSGVIVIDYGDTAEGWRPSPDGTVRTYRTIIWGLIRSPSPGPPTSRWT
jgi:SAM-dependent MidA family methyltransferase